MHKISAVLNKFGLSEKESSVYLTLLKLGPSPVRQVARESGVNRGTTYDILKSLQEQGLVTYYHKDPHQYFVAEDPNRLYEALRIKIENLKKLHNEMGEVVPQLRSMTTVEDRPAVTYYDGTVGLRTILQDVLERVSGSSNKEYYVYSSASIRRYLYATYPDYSEERINRGIYVKVLALGAGGETLGLDERRWLPKEHTAPTYTIIYAGRVAMISTDKRGVPMGLIIADSGLYETQKIIFEQLWERL